MAYHKCSNFHLQIVQSVSVGDTGDTSWWFTDYCEIEYADNRYTIYIYTSEPFERCVFFKKIANIFGSFQPSTYMMCIREKRTLCNCLIRVSWYAKCHNLYEIILAIWRHTGKISNSWKHLRQWHIHSIPFYLIFCVFERARHQKNHISFV